MRPGKAKKERKKAAQTSKLREKFRRVARAAGVEREFSALPAAARDFVRKSYPKPKVCVDGAEAGEPVALEVLAGVEKSLADTHIPLDGDAALSIDDFFTTFLPLLHGFDRLRTGEGLNQLSKVI